MWEGGGGGEAFEVPGLKVAECSVEFIVAPLCSALPVIILRRYISSLEHVSRSAE